jgi:formate dehydrogenase subunit delta
MSTHDEPAKLAHMAGQIADFFRPYPDDVAIAGIAEHINLFWTPHMRETLLARFRPDDPALPPRVGQALSLIRPRRTGA